MSKASAGTAARMHRSPAPEANWQEWISEPTPQKESVAPARRSAAKSVASRGTQRTEVSYEAIALQAYLNWEARGCPIGSPEEDWFRAELQLLGKSVE